MKKISILSGVLVMAVFVLSGCAKEEAAETAYETVLNVAVEQEAPSLIFDSWNLGFPIKPGYSNKGNDDGLC